MTCIIQRLADGAKHADGLTASYPHELYTLEVVTTGIRCRAVYRRDDKRCVMQYEVPWTVLETAHTNPIIEALNLCARAVNEEVSR